MTNWSHTTTRESFMKRAQKQALRFLKLELKRWWHRQDNPSEGPEFTPRYTQGSSQSHKTQLPGDLKNSSDMHSHCISMVMCINASKTLGHIKHKWINILISVLGGCWERQNPFSKTAYTWVFQHKLRYMSVKRRRRRREKERFKDIDRDRERKFSG